MFTDPVADMLTRIRNACRVGKTVVSVPLSIFKAKVLDVMKSAGYVSGYSVEDGFISVALKYYNESPVITSIKRVSKPGRRFYASVDLLKKMHDGVGVFIVSTSRGLMTDSDAVSSGLGGEVVCYLF